MNVCVHCMFVLAHEYTVEPPVSDRPKCQAYVVAHQRPVVAYES